jgi:mannose-1-phosphate guanylyltransferase/mannose-6-phosphate isomerase
MTQPVIQPVILAGGSGTRLWPASRQRHPKQLLPLAGSNSLLQETAVRLRGMPGAMVASDPVVVTSDEYRFVVSDQLRNMGIEHPRIVLEPVGRNTAPALTVAALLAADAGASASGDDAAGAAAASDAAYDDVLLVMPSDHLIADLPAFHAAVAEGAQQAEAGRMVTFGVVPDNADTGYGYIRVGGPVPDAPTARALTGFVEKPDLATAEAYLAAGDYLWNSGIFMMKRSVWLAALDEQQPAMGQACRLALAGAHDDGRFIRLDREVFTACPSDSIDYAVMERLGAAPDAGGAAGAAPLGAAVVPLDAGWSDIGGWASLWAATGKDDSGNVASGNVILEDTRGSLVHAGSRLVTVLGADDLVVVETADAVLVARRDKAHDLKKLVASVRDQDESLTLFHKRVYRPWGFYECLDCGDRFQVKRIMVSPGGTLSLQYHERRAEHWVVVRGVAEVTCGDTVSRLTENEYTYIPVGTPHRLTNPTSEPLEVIEVQSGDYLGEDDIVRLEDSYGR